MSACVRAGKAAAKLGFAFSRSGVGKLDVHWHNHTIECKTTAMATAMLDALRSDGVTCDILASEPLIVEVYGMVSAAAMDKARRERMKATRMALGDPK